MPARGSSAGPTRHHRTNCPPNVVGPLRPQGTTAARQWRPNRARKTRSRHKPWPSRRGTTQDAHYRVCLSSVHGCRFSGPFPIASRFLTAARCPPQPVTLLPKSTMSGPQSSNDDGPPRRSRRCLRVSPHVRCCECCCETHFGRSAHGPPGHLLRQCPPAKSPVHNRLYECVLAT